MKAFTDINQSQKLAEILPIECADMFYDGIRDINTNKYHIPHDSDPTVGKGYEGECSTDCVGTLFLPCWSLAALFNVLPLKIEGVYSDYELKIDMIDKMPRYVLYGDCYHDEFPWNFEKECLLDNVVESIIWLYNNKYLSK